MSWYLLVPGTKKKNTYEYLPANVAKKMANDPPNAIRFALLVISPLDMYPVTLPTMAMDMAVMAKAAKTLDSSGMLI